MLRPRGFSSIDAKPTKPARLRHWNEWSDADTDLLRRLYAEGKTITECCDLFPSRNRNGVKNKLNRLGLRYRRPPKPHEDSRRVCEMALNGLSVDEIRAQLPQLKFGSIYSYVYRRGITLIPKPRGKGKGPDFTHWTAEEDDILMDGVAKQLTFDSIAEQLAGGSVFSIETRIKVLRVYRPRRSATRRRRWEQEEEDLLNELYSKKLSYKDIALRLGRTPLAVQGRLRAFRYK